MGPILVLSLGPALLLLWMLVRWDAKRPEPPGSVTRVVLLGVATCIPAGVIELVEKAVLGDVVDVQGKFLDAFFIAALTEETLKLLVVLLYLWKKPHFDEVMDGILYTAAASLGFAMLENVLYVGNNVGTGVLRAFTAVPLHATASGMMGYCVGRAKFSPGASTLWVLGGLGVAVGVHGTYDWAVMSEGVFGFGEGSPLLALLEVVVIVIVCSAALYGLSRHALALDDALLGPHSRPLPGVGAPRPYAGMPVTVVSTDGGRYPARILSGRGHHYLCTMSDGRTVWIPWQNVAPA